MTSMRRKVGKTKVVSTISAYITLSQETGYPNYRVGIYSLNNFTVLTTPKCKTTTILSFEKMNCTVFTQLKKVLSLSDDFSW